MTQKNKISVILDARDKMTQTLNKASNKLKAFSVKVNNSIKENKDAIQGLAAQGVILG